ncbi:hypothetical protein JX266_012942 [Neoarthrinium moseri]|nr:hypothetical protein JX266_012942 [Neoarthrinium moseri]
MSERGVTAGNTTPQRYIYTPLEDPGRDIRLVTIQAGTWDDPLCIRIGHVPLYPPTRTKDTRKPLCEIKRTLPPGWIVEETTEGRYIFFGYTGSHWIAYWRHPDPEVPAEDYVEQPETIYQLEYEALSYVWGTETELEEVNVQGDRLSGPKSMSLRSTLVTSLRHLRHIDHDRVLWIDQLCIDQNNEAERDQQVLRMADIYQHAYRVVIWLGPADATSGLALKILHYVGMQVSITTENHWNPHPDGEEKDWYDHRTDLTQKIDTSMWNAMENLFARTWFDRLWVLQEASLANSQSLLMCGNEAMDLSTFRRAIACLYTNTSISPEFDGKISQVHKYAHRRGQPISELFRKATTLECYDPRDKVYGLLGLLPAAFRQMIVPEYSSPVATVYQDLVQSHISYTNRLELLRHCEPHDFATVPSWVPDWCGQTLIVFTLRWQFSAAYSRSYTSLEQPNVLRALGVKCAKVSAISPVFKRYDPKGLALLGEWIDQYGRDEDLSENFARTICRNHLSPRTEARHWPTVDEFIHQIKEDGPNLASGKHVRSSFGHTCFEVLHNRMLIVTEDGELGLASYDTEVGDTICVLLGCDSPMVLRESTAGKYRVSGECLLQSLTDGFSLLGPLPKPWRVKVEPSRDFADCQAYLFENTENGEVRRDDPRLEPLEDWECREFRRTASDPIVMNSWRNKITGETINSDPRISPERLTQRGVELEWFRLE